MNRRSDIYNLPNSISALRLILAPVLLILALRQQPSVYLVVLALTVFTDILDGFLARILNKVTALGSRLDSWGDFATYTTMALCAWLLWPGIVNQHRYASLTIVLSFTLPILVGLVKFNRFVSYHTWSVKLAVAMTVVSYIALFSGFVAWPYTLAAVLCVLAALEETAITLILQQRHTDVRSLWQAIKLNR